MTTTPRTATPFARAATAILALAALLATMVGLAAPASAHARLEASSPKEGSTLTATPPEIMLRFNEPIQSGLNEVSVRTGSTDATDGNLEVDGGTVYQPLKSSLPAGSYTVSYKVVSADGHPISGSYSFTYAPPGGDTGPSGSETTSDGGSGSSSSTTSGSDSPTTSAPTAPTSSSTSAGEPSSTSAPSSTTEPSSSSTTSSSTSSSTTSGDGESEPSSASSSSSSTAAPVEGDDASSDGGFPAWGWAVLVGALLVVIAGVGLLLGRRRHAEEDEQVDLEEWRG
ncbi:copper resistance protein CopC [Janibacter sp. G349]|uniref:copper resistance protein CopC n=1 Tax=unclassified Janibacter TaxID=2649294 RepID=UPI003B7EE6AA